ncbi:MAG: stage II sporulation protein R [Syntrophaceticus sp.]
MLQQRKRILLLICLLVIVLFVPFTLRMQAKNAFATNNLIRFHVIANSDQQQDQEVKYMVRDQIINILRQQLIGAKDYQEARKIIIDNRARLVSVAKETVAAAGYSYGVDVDIGRFDFPPKAYGNVVLPQGEYEALRIVLGEGKGANWWCVLFPPLCFVDISGKDLENIGDITKSNIVQETLAQEGNVRNESGVDLRFRLLDWMRRDDGYLAKDKSSQCQ